MERVERAIGQAAEAERSALRALDQAEAARAQREARAADLARQSEALDQQVTAAQAEVTQAQARHAALPDPAQGRAAVETARQAHQAARAALQQAMAAHAALEQGLAVGRERLGGMKADMRNWQARAGDAAKRLAQMATRAEELAQERAVSAAKPAGLIAEIEQGEAIARALPPISPRPKPRWPLPKRPARPPMPRWPRPTKRSPPRAKPAPRPAPAPRTKTSAARKWPAFPANASVPAPLLAERFAFASADVGEAAAESATHERLMAERERIGPVNLVAAEELAQAEARQAESLAEQAELAEAVNRLRGSIGNLNREGRERLRAAFEAVDGHFRRLFTACSAAAKRIWPWWIATIRWKQGWKSWPSRRASACNRSPCCQAGSRH
jgi:chromosome segregation protein